MWPIYGAAIQRAIGDRLNDEEAGILAAFWASSIRAGTMTADHRVVLLVRINRDSPFAGSRTPIMCRSAA
jgi:hypothetical protein